MSLGLMTPDERNYYLRGYFKGKRGGHKTYPENISTNTWSLWNMGYDAGYIEYKQAQEEKNKQQQDYDDIASMMV